MNTAHIEKIFADYVNTNNTQYAIMLNGKWGCGKTYFWKNDLVKIAKENDLKAIYISLNGISKIDNLDHQLFIKLLPYISNQENKVIKNTTRLLTNVTNKLSSIFFKTNLAEIFKGVSIESLNFSKYVICFDDLERCQIPVKEVLGFINNLVEHKNLKTIVLAHEKEVDKSGDYERIKEKVIGRNLNFKLDISSTLPNLFVKYKTEKTKSFHDFLITQKEYIVGILIEYEEENLRVINFYLDALERIFPSINDIDEKYIKEIILFSALISIEFKNGSLSSSDYMDYKDIDIIDEHFYSLHFANPTKVLTNEDEETKSYSKIFYEKYLENRVKTYFFYPSIYSFILSGYFDQPKLQSELKKREPEVIPKETQDFRALLHYKFRELSNEDFKTLTKNVLQYTQDGKYFIYDYVQIAKFFYYFSDNNLISESKEDIDQIIFEGLDIAKKQKQINDRVLENLMHFGDENPNVEKIKKAIVDIHNEIKKDEYVANANELIDSLRNKDEFVLASIFKRHQFSKEFFQYINADILFDAILNISNKQLFNFTELLEYRYNSTNIGEFLYEDIKCLTELNTQLSDHLDKTQNIEQPRAFLLSSLQSVLEKIIKHLNNTRLT